MRRLEGILIFMVERMIVGQRGRGQCLDGSVTTQVPVGELKAMEGEMRRYASQGAYGNELN